MTYGFVHHLAPLAVAAPLICAAALMPLSRHLPRAAADAIATAAALAVTAMCAALTIASTHAPIVYWMGGWVPRHALAVGIGFVVDPIGGGLATLAALLVSSALVFSWRYFDSVGTLFHTLMLAFLAAMCGFALTGDLFNLFVWFELMGVAAYALTAQKIEEPEAIAGAINFAITNSAGAFCVLLGIGLLYGRTGALNPAQIGTVLAQRPADALVIVALLLITCGFFVKGAVMPFHFWLDDAHAVAPTPVCVLFSGVMVQLGLYAVARIYWTCFSPALGTHAAAVQALFIGVGIVTALAGASLAYSQSHLKRLLAFSTVSHSGMFVCAIALFNAAGAAAAALFIAAHGLIKSSLFMCAGIVLNRFKSMDEGALHGRGRSLPVTRAVYFAGALGLAGLPPLGISAAKVLFDASFERQAMLWIAAVVALASAIDAGAVLRFGLRVFAGIGVRAPGGPLPQTQPTETRSRNALSEKLTMLAPAIALPAISIWLALSGTFVHGVERAARLFTDQPAYAAATLAHRVQPWPGTAGEALDPSAYAINLAVCAGALLFALAGAFGFRLPGPLRAPFMAIRRLHSGIYVDYIAYMMFGIGAYGVWLILAR